MEMVLSHGPSGHIEPLSLYTFCTGQALKTRRVTYMFFLYAGHVSWWWVNSDWSWWRDAAFLERIQQDEVYKGMRLLL